MIENPFLLLEAQVAFFLDAGNGGAGARLWMGGEAERLTMNRSYKERLFYRPGEPYGRSYAEDEDHEIVIENLWSEELGGKQMPQVERNARMILVIVWFDREVGAWAKRTYFGLTSRNQNIVGEIRAATNQALRLRAEHLVEEAGQIIHPSMTPGTAWGGVVCHVGAGGSPVEQIGVLGADGVIQAAAGFAYLAYAGGALQIGAAAVASPGGFACTSIIATGGSFPTDNGQARFEFISGGRRLASLGEDGVLYVPDAFEATGSPAGAVFTAKLPDGSWLFSLTPSGIYAASFTTTL